MLIIFVTVQIAELADIARCVANAPIDEESSLSYLVSCMEDLQEVVNHRKLEALTVQTFGTRIEKLHQWVDPTLFIYFVCLYACSCVSAFNFHECVEVLVICVLECYACIINVCMYMHRCMSFHNCMDDLYYYARLLLLNMIWNFYGYLIGCLSVVIHFLYFGILGKNIFSYAMQLILKRRMQQVQ